jgi:hypothetical protein
MVKPTLFLLGLAALDHLPREQKEQMVGILLSAPSHPMVVAAVEQVKIALV